MFLGYIGRIRAWQHLGFVKHLHIQQCRVILKMTDTMRWLGDENHQFTVSCSVKAGQSCLQSRGSRAAWVISPLITQRRGEQDNRSRSLLSGSNLLITLQPHIVADTGIGKLQLENVFLLMLHEVRSTAVEYMHKQENH